MFILYLALSVDLHLLKAAVAVVPLEALLDDRASNVPHLEAGVLVVRRL
jgi:hypothetical protein